MGNYKTGGGNYRSSVRYTVRQKADLDVPNSTTLVNTDLVTQTLKVGKSYRITLILLHNSSAVANYKIAWSADVSATLRHHSLFAYTATDQTTSITTAITGTGAGAKRMIVYHTFLIDVTVATTITMKFAQNTQEASATLFMKGSSIIVEEI